MKEVVNYIQLARVHDGERSDSQAGGEILEDLLKTVFPAVCFRCDQHTNWQPPTFFIISQPNKISGCSSGTFLPDRAISQNKDGYLGDCVFCEMWSQSLNISHKIRTSKVSVDFGFHVFIPTALINCSSDTPKCLYVLVTITSSN